MTEDLGRAKTFFQFMDAVMASGLTPNQRLILIAQAKHADAHDGELTDSYPSEETLASETGLSKDTIQRRRKELAELGWLVQTHSGRGGSSKKSNAYDLAIPDGAPAKPHDAVLQSRTVPRQSRTESLSKPRGAATSTSSSTPRSAAASTAKQGGSNQSSEGTKEGYGDGDSYWVGYSKKRPDGYFHRTEGSREPKGNHVLVTLTRTQVMNLFGVGYEYPQLRDIMLGYARDAGLRPPSGPTVQAGPSAAGESVRSTRPVSEVPADEVRARPLSRAERDELYGPSPFTTVVRPSSESSARSFDEERRRYLSRTPEQKQAEYKKYRRQMDRMYG